MKLGDIVTCVLEGVRAAKPKIGFWLLLSGEWILNDGRTIDKGYRGNIMFGRMKEILIGLSGSLLGLPFWGRYCIQGLLQECVIKENILDEESIGKNVKDKKSLAGRWQVPGFQHRFCHYHGGILVKVFQPQLYVLVDVNPRYSAIQPRATVTHHRPCPAPAYLGLLVYHEQSIIISESRGVVGQSLRNIWLLPFHAYIILQKQDPIFCVLLKKYEKNSIYKGSNNDLHSLDTSI